MVTIRVIGRQKTLFELPSSEKGNADRSKTLAAGAVLIGSALAQMLPAPTAHAKDPCNIESAPTRFIADGNACNALGACQPHCPSGPFEYLTCEAKQPTGFLLRAGRPGGSHVNGAPRRPEIGALARVRSGADLRRSSLIAADLSQAGLSGTDLNGMGIEAVNIASWLSGSATASTHSGPPTWTRWETAKWMVRRGDAGPHRGQRRPPRRSVASVDAGRQLSLVQFHHIHERATIAPDVVADGPTREFQRVCHRRVSRLV